MAKEDRKTRMRKIIPRLLKTVILSIIFYLVISYISSLLGPLEAFFPLYRPLTNFFAATFIFLLFAAELSHGTVLRYAFSFARTFLFIVYLIYILNGGLLNLSIPNSGAPVNVMVDVRIFLTMLAFVLSLGLSKTMLQTIEFFSQKVPKDQTAPTEPSIEKLGVR